MGGFDAGRARERFPSLSRTVAGLPAVYADGPGGTQVVDSAIEAMSGYMRRGGSNIGGPFVTSVETGAVEAAARRAMADFVGAQSPAEIVFGQNMTSLTFALGRALARTWEPGDEVVVTRLDHDANVSTWMTAAAEAGAVVRHVDFDAGTGRLDPAAFDAALGDRTKLVAVTHASNAIGTVVDVAEVSRRAHEAGALVFVDAVHYAPHGLIDVAEIGCDFLAVSAYKFFGPHTGVLYGRLDLLEAIDAIKIRPSSDDAPVKWESGTQSFESLTGVTAAVDYVASIGAGDTRRDRLVSAMALVRDHERQLAERFLDGIGRLDHVRLHGIPTSGGRTPTFAVGVDGLSPQDVAARLGEQGIFAWHGDFYAPEVMVRLGVHDEGGLVRIGFVHYNTLDEVDRVVGALSRLH